MIFGEKRYLDVSVLALLWQRSWWAFVRLIGYLTFGGSFLAAWKKPRFSLVKEFPSFLHYLAASCKVFGDSYSACLGNLIDTVIDLTYFNKNLFPSPFGVLSSCQSSQYLGCGCL